MTTGEWCTSYASRLDNKFKSGKMDKDKYSLSRSFIVNKVKSIETLQKRYGQYSPERRRQFDRMFDKLKNELCDYFLKIINGRVNSFKLRSTTSYEDISDIIQDAFLCVMRYINRYDPNRCTSAFAYVTELATNSIVLSLNQIKERSEKMITGLDYFDNINTIDTPTSSTQSGLTKFMDE